MSNETPNTDPLDFMKGMWGNMGFSLPGMVTPTFDTDELEKRIADLKAVEGWLRMNLSMLQMTIQGLEMQHSTLSAVKAMSQMATERPAAGPATDSEEVPPPAAMWPWSMMQQMHAHLNPQATPATEVAPEAAAEPAARKPAPEKPAGGRRTKKP